MEYNAPVLLEVAQAANLVLGVIPGGNDSNTDEQTLPFDLALGLDE